MRGNPATQGQGAAEAEAAELKMLVAESYAPADPGPYPQDKPPENQVRFTPVQVCLPTNFPLLKSLREGSKELYCKRFGKTLL